MLFHRRINSANLLACTCTMCGKFARHEIQQEYIIQRRLKCAKCGEYFWRMKEGKDEKEN